MRKPTFLWILFICIVSCNPSSAINKEETGTTCVNYRMYNYTLKDDLLTLTLREYRGRPINCIPKNPRKVPKIRR